MLLSVQFNFVCADPCDPQSADDCELLDIQIDDVTVPLRVENDLVVNRHLLAALYRLHQILPK
jgi:hypothetical protein